MPHSQKELNTLFRPPNVMYRPENPVDDYYEHLFSCYKHLNGWMGVVLFVFVSSVPAHSTWATKSDEEMKPIF